MHATTRWLVPTLVEIDNRRLKAMAFETVATAIFCTIITIPLFRISIQQGECTMRIPLVVRRYVTHEESLHIVLSTNEMSISCDSVSILLTT